MERSVMTDMYSADTEGYIAMYTSERTANFSNGYEGNTFSPI